MINVRKSADRGHAHHGWLKSAHTFSFADYYDSSHMGFRVLRVINEDLIQGGKGFGMHGHRDMEILTYMLSGSLEHKDSMGNSEIIRPGEIQRMSAGTGVRHSEWNGSDSETAHLLQIWLLPEQNNLEPSYEQKSFEDQLNLKSHVLLASPNREEQSVKIHQDIRLWASRSPSGAPIEIVSSPHRHFWIQVAKGSLSVLGIKLETGDGAAISNQTQLKIEPQSASEFLIFDLP